MELLAATLHVNVGISTSILMLTRVITRMEYPQVRNLATHIHFSARSLRSDCMEVANRELII